MKADFPRDGLPYLDYPKCSAMFSGNTVNISVTVLGQQETGEQDSSVWIKYIVPYGRISDYNTV